MQSRLPSSQDEVRLTPLSVSRLMELGNRKRLAFTLVELLAVIAIVGILVAVLFPAPSFWRIHGLGDHAF